MTEQRTFATACVSLRERARAVLAVAVATYGDTVEPVTGALDLLVAGTDDGCDLGQRFDLRPTAEAVLTLALAPDLAPELGAAFAYLAGDATQRRPSLGLALSLLGERPDIDLTIVDDLMSRGLLRVSSGNDQPVAAAPMVPVHGLVAHLLGAPELPEGVSRGSDLVARSEAWRGSLRKGSVPSGTSMVHLRGPDRSVLRETAVALADTLDRDVLFAGRGPISRHLLYELTREARLRDALVVVEDLAPDEPAASLGHLPQPVLHLGIAGPPQFTDGVAALTMTIPPASARERTAVWLSALPKVLSGEARRLGDCFRLSPAQIRAAVAQTRAEVPRGDLTATAGPLLEAAARSQTGADLAALAPRVEPLPRWSRLVLPPDARTQLEELIARVNQRRRVVEEWGFAQRRSAHPTTALFVGPPGTGKTMAAEAVAERLGLPLHRIDLSRVVSKYIGETEQQLDAIFDAAARTTAILFFDEADALFGKRSEVRDAHDRYANLEVSYLLQRMESHDGVALLATNLAANIDEAFTRRLDFTVYFPFPDLEARLALWRDAWPAQTPIEDLDGYLDRLAAAYELSGGNIRNVAIASAYLAAADGGTVTRGHVRRALQRELQKIGVRNDEDELVSP